MEQPEKFRKEETRRLIEWIKKNKSDWLGIKLALTEENMLIASEFKEVIRSLRNNEFYQLIVVLLYTNNEVIQNTLDASILSCINNNWNDDLPDKAIDLLLDNITDNFD